jgi:hypothetical protein
MSDHSLRKLVHRELTQVGCKAQDAIVDDDAFGRVNTELTKAWDFCRANNLEAAAEIAIRMRVETDKIVEKEKRGADRK